MNEENENYIRRGKSFMAAIKDASNVDDVKEDEIKRPIKNGVLSLTVPKTKPTKKQGIKIDIQ